MEPRCEVAQAQKERLGCQHSPPTRRAMQARTTRHLSVRQRVATALLLAVGAAGCTDDPARVIGPEGARASVSGSLRSGTRDLGQDVEHQFGPIEVRAVGPFRPNTAINLTISVPTRLASTRAALVVHLPELDELEYRRQHGRPRTTIANPSVRLRWEGPVGAGSRITQIISVSLPAPGLYRARVVVTGEAPTASERPVQNVAVREVWFWIRAAGGRFIADPNEVLRSEEIQRSPEVLQQYAVMEPCGEEYPDEPGCEPPPPPPPTADIQGRAVYYNSRLGEQPLANTLIHFFDEFDPSRFAHTSVTGPDGRFVFPCPPASLGANPQIVLVTENADVVVNWADRANYGGGPPSDVLYRKGISSADCGTDLGNLASALYGQTELYDNVRRTVIGSRALFNDARAKTEVRFFVGSSETNYEPSGDFIRVQEGEAFGTRGVYVAAHEYGHGFMHTRLGGLIGYQTDCLAHEWATPAPRVQCAWHEGFASYYAGAIWGPAMGSEYQRMIDGEYNRADGAGPRREGAVAAVLFDLTDGTKADRAGFLPSFPYTDNASESHDDLLDAIRNCRIGGNRVDGVDYLMHCFERRIEVVPGSGPCPFDPKQTCDQPLYLKRVDVPVHNSRFASARGASLPSPTAWAWGGALYRSGYNVAVRRMWECNLFLVCTQ